MNNNKNQYKVNSKVLFTFKKTNESQINNVTTMIPTLPTNPTTSSRLKRNI